MYPYSTRGDTVYDAQGRLMVTISFAPSGRKTEFAMKIARWMNIEEEQKNSRMDETAHTYKMAAQDDLEKDELPIREFEEQEPPMGYMENI